MARKRISVFSLSFLDVMSCGFGAVVLVYLLINHATEVEYERVNQDILSEIRKLDYEVLVGKKDLVSIQDAIDENARDIDRSNQKRVSLNETKDRQKRELDEIELASIAEIESLNALKADVKSREEEVKRLQAAVKEGEGNKARTFAGAGDRQYLTGLKVGGKRILIAVDKSASMLDETLVNILRRRNMSTEKRLAAPKWQRAISTANWLSAQMPLDSEFQFVSFDTEVHTLNTVEGWQEVANKNSLSEALDNLATSIPENGTNLEALFTYISNLSPLPDSIFLLVDGLPTLGAKAPRKGTITGRNRMRLFNDALRSLPPKVPMNVIMFPMEGDPMAAASFWGLAVTTGGAFLSPSSDWP